MKSDILTERSIKCYDTERRRRIWIQLPCSQAGEKSVFMMQQLSWKLIAEGVMAEPCVRRRKCGPMGTVATIVLEGGAKVCPRVRSTRRRDTRAPIIWDVCSARAQDFAWSTMYLSLSQAGLAHRFRGCNLPKKLNRTEKPLHSIQYRRLLWALKKRLGGRW